MGAFLSGIFGGSNPTLNKLISQTGAEAGQEQGVGSTDVNAASKFYTDILSGDPTKTAQAIAPETAAAQEGAQQQKNQMAQFSPRSGGTAAASAGMDAATRANLIKLLGSLKTGAASGAASLGTSQEGLALSAQQLQDQASQQQMANWQNSILGQAISGAVNYGESFLPVPHGGS